MRWSIEHYASLMGKNISTLGNFYQILVESMISHYNANTEYIGMEGASSTTRSVNSPV